MAPFTSGAIEASSKADHSPVTEADHAVNAVLRERLLRPGEGWLSEESKDMPERMGCAATWIVDPIDGTIEFIKGIPEWCVSVGYAHQGRAIAGGILNPATGELVLGSLDTGVTYNGEPVRASNRIGVEGALVLASRSEVARKEWDCFSSSRFEVRPMGSVAYKLALVAAGKADATWTLSPKHEWDVAAGAALIAAAGGSVFTLKRQIPSFNQQSCKLSGLVASGPQLADEVWRTIEPQLKTRNPL